MNKIFGSGLIIWGAIIAGAAAIWFDPAGSDVGRRIGVFGLGAIMIVIGILRLTKGNLSRVGRRPRRAQMPGDQDEEQTADSSVSSRFGKLRASYPTTPGFKLKVKVYDFGFEHADDQETQTHYWNDIAVIQYWDDLGGAEMRIYPRKGRELCLQGRTKAGIEFGNFSRDDINDLIAVVQEIAEEHQPTLDLRRTPFSIALGADGQPIEAPFLIQSFGVISILFFWFPFIGLALAVAAMLLNRRIGGWGKITSWIGLILSTLVTLTCAGMLGWSMLVNVMGGNK